LIPHDTPSAVDCVGSGGLLTFAEYDALLIAQDGRCAICRAPPSPRRALAVDHCHVTHRVRGLLCDRCNLGIGLFGDSPSALRSAASYLAP